VIAALIAYALLAGSAVALTAWSLDRGAALTRMPRRWIWLTAMIGVVLLSLLPTARALTSVAGFVEATVTDGHPSGGLRSAPPVLVVDRAVRDRLDRLESRGVAFDAVLAIVWAGGR
jgi:hypothetical protein